MTFAEVREHFKKNDTFARHLGIEIEDMSEGSAVAVMPFDERHRNGMGIAHGGAIFALVDLAFAAATNTSGMFCVNAQTSISYLAAGKCGPLRGEARVLNAGRKLVTCEVVITDGEGTVAARAVVTGYVTSVPVPA